MSSLKRFLKRQHNVQPTDEQDQEKEDQLLVNVFEQEPITKVETLSTDVKSAFGFNKKELTIEEHITKIEKMTKAQLHDYAKKYEIYLDRKRTKENMINEFIQKLKEKN
jgi:hypothetical protein